MNAQTHWFRPKRYGYGAEPANWRGWVATVIYLAIALAIAWAGMIAPALEGREQTTILPWIALFGVTLAFIWLCRVKSDGEWRWRWGLND